MPKKIAPQAVAPQKRLKLAYVRTADLKLWEGNPRRNDAAARELAKVIEAHGFIDPIIAAKDNTVYAGNTRLKAARLLGIEEVPVIYGAFRDRAQAVRYAIANNRSAELSSWDEDVLADIFGEQESVDMEVLSKETGFAQTEIEGLRDGTDIPTLEKTPRKGTERTCPKCGHTWVE